MVINMPITNKSKLIFITIAVAVFTITALNQPAPSHAHGFFSLSSKQNYKLHYTVIAPPENPSYKQWCENRFENGALVYEAYRKVAFNLNYAQEPAHNDFWQTPLETLHRHAGDCEDAVLLFNNIIASQINNGRIVWGVMENLDDKTDFAHVWLELCDKNGRLYFVDPFTKDWNGIIPMDSLKTKRVKAEILSAPAALVNDLLNNKIEVESIKSEIIKKEGAFDRKRYRLIDDILSKLKRVSRRYMAQKNVLKEKEDGAAW